MTRKPLQYSQSLMIAIEDQRAKVDTREILTRSQQKLQAEVQELETLEDEKKMIAKDLADCRNNILGLVRLYDTLEAQEQDIDVLLQAARDSVHALRSKGIEVPEARKGETQQQAIARNG